VNFVYHCRLDSSPLATLLKTMDMLIVGKTCLEKELPRLTAARVEAKLKHFEHYWSMFKDEDYEELRFAGESA